MKKNAARPKITAKLVKQFRLAAERGEAEAQFHLGLAYYSGQGVEQDLAEAVNWYRLAAEQGHVKARVNLGLACFGLERDRAEAVKWFRLAAEQGDVKAWYNLFWAYSWGLGVKEDKDEADKWMGLVREQGELMAQFYVPGELDGELGEELDEHSLWLRREGDSDYTVKLSGAYVFGEDFVEGKAETKK